QGPDKGEIIARFEVRSGRLEVAPSFVIQERGGRVRPSGCGILVRFEALRLDEERPSRAQSAQGVIEAGDGGKQFRVERAREVGSSKRDRLLKKGVLLKDDTRSHESRPGKTVGQPIFRFSIFAQVQHRGESSQGSRRRPCFSASTTMSKKCGSALTAAAQTRW